VRDLENEAWAAYSRALVGVFGPADELLSELRSHDDPTAAAWRMAMEAARWAAGLEGALPDARSVSAFASAPAAARTGAVVAGAIAAQTAVARLDGAALATWPDVLIAVAGRDCRPEAHIAARLARSWSELARGEHDGLADRAAAIEVDAAREKSAAQVVEAATLCAFAALERGEFERALAVARRASRMARTEALPQSEYLANVVLARMRRHAGRVHLATRILAAIGRVAPPQWLGWLAWELLAAGDIATSSDLVRRALDSPASRATVALADAIGAAAAGRAARVRNLGGEAVRALADWESERAYCTDVLVAADPAADLSTASDEVRTFCLGAADLPPHLLGASTWPRADEDVGAPHLVATPNGVRRILAIGAGIVDGSVHEPKLATRQLRTETAAAALVLAGPDGVARDVFFRELYGLSFKPATHQGVLDVLLHRVRAYLGPAATMTRSDEAIRVTVDAPLLLLDAPTDRPLEDQLLRALARGRGRSAREVASELGVALRTVQSALRTLVDEGECSAERKGRVVEYRVEDTTFDEPTQVGTGAGV
jgi:hypothetical protein